MVHKKFVKKGAVYMQNKNAIKMAYVIFLIICAIYYIVSDIFHLEFENWERIVCATTIASYFFSGADARKTILSVAEKIKESLHYSNKELIKIKNEWEHDSEKNNGNIYNIEDLNDCINESESTILRLTNDIETNHKLIFRSNVVGFVVFFCILTFGDVFRFFEKRQEFYTLLAFIVILAAETYQEHWVEKYSSLVEIVKKLNYKEENKNE